MNYLRDLTLHVCAGCKRKVLAAETPAGWESGICRRCVVIRRLLA